MVDGKPVEKVDFNALVERMKAQGAFDEYPTPLGTTDATTLGEGSYHNPRYPGDRCYGLSARQIRSGDANIPGVNIPQDLIDAQHQSTKDAIRHYMPDEQVATWMKDYFSDDFIHERSFRRHISDLHHIQDQPFALLSPADTSHVAKVKRDPTSRALYTQEQFDATIEICAKHPALPIAVMGYQAAFLGYLDKIEDAIKHAPTLSKEEKKRGRDATEWLNDLSRNTSFYSVILPAVAISYQKNHTDMSDKLTPQDFNEAMKDLSRKQAFQLIVPYADQSGQVEVKCPMHRMINVASTNTLDSNPAATDTETKNSMADQLGKLLFDAYDKYSSLTLTTHAQKKASGDLQTIIEKAIGRKRLGLF